MSAPFGRHAASPEGEVNVLEVANVLLRRWRTVVGIPLVAAAVTGGISVLVPPAYTARTTFVPEARSQSRLPTGLAGLTGQLGIPLGIDASQSPRFYAQVAKSREILERLLLTSYPDPRGDRGGPDSVTLLRILRVRGKTYEDSLQRGVKELSKLTAVTADNQTNIVSVTVSARFPRLAAAIANNLVDYLNEFNTKTRQSQARERRKFVEGRLADGERALRLAEEQLKSFYQLNRSWQQSPQLTFEEGRLRRQVDIQQELYLTLRREHETARIEEVNDTPVITVIDPAKPPQEKAKPKRTLLVVLALVIGTGFGASWAFGVEYLNRLRRIDEAVYRDFRNLLRQVPRQAGDAMRGVFRRTRS